MTLGILLAIVGVIGCVVFGVSFGFDALSGAHFKKAMGTVPGLVQRSRKGMLKMFLLSLAVLAAGVLLMSVCSTRPHPSESETSFSCRPDRLPDHSGLRT
jgi:hypothetical protein